MDFFYNLNVYRFTCGHVAHLKRRRPSCQTGGRSTMVASEASHDCRWTQNPSKDRPSGANGSYTRPKLGPSSAVIAISRMPASRRRNSKPRRRQRQALSVGGIATVTDKRLGFWSRKNFEERSHQSGKSHQFRNDLAECDERRVRRRDQTRWRCKWHQSKDQQPKQRRDG